jgi:alpha/beta superfamily hydrolase
VILSSNLLPGENIQAFYFGGSEQALFGIYHIPPKALARSHAILLCPSIEQEAIRGHRAYRQLAVRLSRLGFPVMRFDYWGTGDSKGDSAPTSLGRWQQDIAEAIGEIKRRSGVDHICLAGLRLGGTLAILATASLEIDGIALWEPVISGKAYVEALQEWHRDKLRYFLSEMPTVNHGGQSAELLGMEINQAFLDALETLDLLTIQQPPAKQMLLVEHQSQPEVAAFKTSLQQWQIDLQHHCVDDPRVWTDDPDKALVPNQVLQTLTAWFSEKFK